MQSNLQTVLVLSGPNLNLLGQRQPEIYGTDSLQDHMRRVGETAAQLGLQIETVSAQGVAEIVEAIHSARGRCAAIIIMPWQVLQARLSKCTSRTRLLVNHGVTRVSLRQLHLVQLLALGQTLMYSPFMLSQHC
jgi:hypothetical protein